MGGDPAAVRHRPMHDVYVSAVAQLVDDAIGLVGRHLADALLDVILAARSALLGEPRFQDGTKCNAGPGLLLRQLIESGIFGIAEDQSLLGVEHADALRHMLQRHGEALPGRLLVLAVTGAAPAGR